MLSLRNILVPTLAVVAGTIAAAEGQDPPKTQPPTPTPPAPSLEERIDELDQQLRILKRKAELAQESAAKSGSTTSIGDKGFSFVSADKAYSLKIGAYVQTDGRFFLDDNTGLNTDQLLVRRARLIFSGNLAPWLEYRIMPDYVATPILQDAYANATLTPAFQVQAGQFKQPVGLERIRSDANITFLERGFPTNLAPNRDIGVELHGDLGTAATWEVGVFNGTPDGQASVTGDTNDDKDFAARLWATPFAGGNNNLIKGLGFGVGGTAGYSSGTPATTNLPTHRSLGQAIIFSYARPAAGQTLANTTIPNGQHTRIYPQLYWNVDQWSVLAEYAISQQDLSLAGNELTADTRAWQVQLAYVLTGENEAFRGVKPNRPFAPGNGLWGAWEIAIRATGITFDQDAIDAGFATTTSVESATAYGAALNWYLSNNLKWQFDLEKTIFDGGGTAVGLDRKDETVASTRVQFSF